MQNQYIPVPPEIAEVDLSRLPEHRPESVCQVPTHIPTMVKYEISHMVSGLGRQGNKERRNGPFLRSMSPAWSEFAIRLEGRPRDIACQYFRYLSEHIEADPALYVPPHVKLIHAIGLFHVHGYKDECLYRWATTYVPGMGTVDGEILETLWSVLNKISASTRTASLVHRTEILDDHMGDNNFKKITNIGENTMISSTE
jgi:hypothetical protein